MTLYYLCGCGNYWESSLSGAPLCRKQFEAFCVPINNKKFTIQEIEAMKNEKSNMS